MPEQLCEIHDSLVVMAPESAKMPTMSKKPTKRHTGEPKTPAPSRAGYKSTYLLRSLWDMLSELGEEQRRSGAFMVRIAVEEYLQRAGYDLRTGKRTGNP